MGNLQSKRTIWIKGWLFLALGLVAIGMLILLRRDVTTLVLVAIAIWSFYRFYYFAFYVIQHYVDPQYRFAGLFDFLRYCLTGDCVDRQDNGKD